jgi:pilus assembly protein CpaE
MTRAERHFVLNRADSKVGVDLAQVAALMGHQIDIKLPSTRAVPRSMNEGIPLIESTPHAPFARRMTELVGRIAPETAHRRRRRARR